MICNEPTVTESEDLMIFQEWKNRNKRYHFSRINRSKKQCCYRFPRIHDFEIIFWHDVLRNQYDAAISILFDVFTNLTKLRFGSQHTYSADECFEIIESIQKYWKKNPLGKCQHSIRLNSAIPKVICFSSLKSYYRQHFRNR